MEIKVDYTTKADGWRNGALTPKGIMVHSTATPGVMAQAFRDRWDRPNVGASVHAFLDNTGVVQCLPWNKKAGHAGGSANNTHIAFEICEPGGFRYVNNKITGYDVAAQTPYFNAIWQNAVELCAMLCKEYNLKPENILCHSEGYKKGIASNHGDVMHWFPLHGKDMDDFRAAVAAALSGAQDQAPEYEAVDYQAKVTAQNGLNCRATPSASGAKVTGYAYGTTLHITQESGTGWGYTGDGWVSLDYVEKIEPVKGPEEQEDDDVFTYEQFKQFMAQYRAELGTLDASGWAKAEGVQDRIQAEAISDGTRPQEFLTREEGWAMLLRAMEDSKGV